MHQATRTLLASLIRRCAPIIICQIALTALLCFLLRDVDLELGQRGFQPRGDMRTLVETGSEEFLASLLLVGVNALVAGGFVLLLHSDTKRLKIGLPMRIFLLPMSSAKILVVHMLFGTAAVALPVAVASVGSQWALDSPIAWWLPVCLCATAFAALQAWAFTLAERRRSIAWGSLVGAIALAALLVRVEAVGRFLTESAPGILALVTLGMVGGSTGVTLAFGRDMRYSAFDVVSSRRHVRPNRKPFSSPFAAQVWYEWRRVGWVLPVVSSTALFAFFLGMPLVVALFMGSDITGYSSWVGYAEFFTIQWETSIHLIVTAVQTTAVGASVLSGAYAMLLSGEWRGRSTFLRSRPIRTRRLSMARIVVMALSALVSLVSMMAITFSIAAIVGFGNLMGEMVQYLHLGFEHVPDPLVLAFFWSTIFIALWVGLWMAECALIGVAYAAPALILYGMASVATLLFNTDPMFSFAESATVWLGSLLCIGTTAAIALYAALNNLVSARRFLVAAAAYVVYAGAFVYYGLDFRVAKIMEFIVAQDWAIPFPHPINWPLWVGLSVLPILPLFSHPVQLDRWRTMR